MQHSRFRAFLTLLVILLIGQSCGSDSKRKRSREASQPASTTATSAPALNEIHFFLETSASMGGYLKGSTEFKDVVSELVTKANQIKPITIYTISGKPQPVKADVNAFVAQLATTPLATGKSSELHQIFRQVGEKARGNGVAILVSDCILSFPDADIKRDPEVNRNNASSTLKNNIYDQFATFSKQGIGATVYAFTSAFNGTYYTYQNQKQTLSGEKRPFYVWVIGKQELLADFNRELQDRLSAQPVQRLDFGASNALKKYDLFFSLNKKGDWRAVRNNVAEIKTGRKADPIEFAIGLNLDKLPSYAQAESYLKQNLKTKVDNGTVKLVNVHRRDAVTSNRMSEREQKLLSQNTHVLTFRVESLFDNEANVALALPVRFATWYTDWSTMDDRTAEGRRNKTFALEHLMNGVREAYQTGNNEFAQLNFKLIKD